MTQIFQAIDDYSEENFGYLKSKFWGFCELSYKSAKDSKGTLIGASGSQPIVMTALVTEVNGERRQVSLDDKLEFITWIRWVEPLAAEINQDWSFGREETEENTLTLRIVVAHKAILGETLILSFARGLPKRITASGFRYIFMTGRPRINPDHESIYQTELGNTAYEKHRFTWNLYTVDVAFNFIQCVETTP